MNNPHILQRILSRHHESTQCGVYLYVYTLTFNIDVRPVFLNRRAVAPIIPGPEKFLWKFFILFSQEFFINKYFLLEIFWGE